MFSTGHFWLKEKKRNESFQRFLGYRALSYFFIFSSTNTGNLPQDKTRRIHEEDGMQFGRTFAIQVDIYDQTQILKEIIDRRDKPCVANTASKAAQGVSLTFGGCSKKRGHNVKPKNKNLLAGSMDSGRRCYRFRRWYIVSNRLLL